MLGGLVTTIRNKNWVGTPAGEADEPVEDLGHLKLNDNY
jgi:hypothetical protein